jgi:hypothetical protein
LYQQPYPSRGDREALLISKGYCETLYQVASVIASSGWPAEKKAECIVSNIAGYLEDRSADSVYVARDALTGFGYLTFALFASAGPDARECVAMRGLITSAARMFQLVYTVLRLSQLDDRDSDDAREIRGRFDFIKEPDPHDAFHRAAFPPDLRMAIRDRQVYIPA